MKSLIWLHTLQCNTVTDRALSSLQYLRLSGQREQTRKRLPLVTLLYQPKQRQAMLAPPYNIHSINMPIHQTARKTQSKVDHSWLRWHIVSGLVVTVDPTPKPSCYSLYGSGSYKILLIFQSKQVLLRVSFAMGT